MLAFAETAKHTFSVMSDKDRARMAKLIGKLESQQAAVKEVLEEARAAVRRSVSSTEDDGVHGARTGERHQGRRKKRQS